MEARSNFEAARILCIEHDFSVLESRCAVLKHLGYDAASASPRVAQMLRRQKFDLIVVPSLSDDDLPRILNLSDGADILVLDEFSAPSEFLSMVARRLNRRRRA
jgi:hypothetical protein